jgi:hypothetical protein
MSAPNFSYDRRCVLVPAGGYGYEFGGNCPALGDCFDNDRSYPSRYLADYKDDFATVAIVLTSGYYADACIDIVDREDKADELLGYANYYSNHNRQELVDDICYFLGCSRNFANTRLKGCRKDRDDYEYRLEKAFEKIVEDWRDVELVKANKVVDKIMKDYGLRELCCTARFSNGEAWYDYVK